MEIFNSLFMNTKNITTPLDETQKQNIIQLIPKLDQKGHDLLFFLIRMYHTKESKDITFQIPYHTSATVDKQSDIEFDLKDFPNHLQHMIFMFVRMHYEYISYETSRTDKP